MRSYNLQWYVDKLKKGQKFSLIRFGDGEFYCMWGKQGQNSNGCKYTPELREALLKSMEPQANLIHGMQRVLPKDRARAEAEYPEIDWYDTEIFSEAVANGELYPLIEVLKGMRLVVIGNETIRPFIFEHFNARFIEVPKSNAYGAGITIPHYDNVVYLFSCGMAANAFIAEMHGKTDSWLIDVGHIWDPFVGLMSRCDLEGKTLQDIEKNLKP